MTGLDTASEVLMNATFKVLGEPPLDERIRGLVSSAIEQCRIAEENTGNVLCFCRRYDEGNRFERNPRSQSCHLCR